MIDAHDLICMLVHLAHALTAECTNAATGATMLLELTADRAAEVTAIRCLSAPTAAGYEHTQLRLHHTTQ